MSCRTSILGAHVLAATVVLLTMGCPAAPDTVTLTVLTDFEVGEQFVLARYAFTPLGGGAPTLAGELDGASFTRGAGLASATSGARPFMPSPHRYRVELVRSDGTVAASAAAESSFVGSGAQSVYLTITRSDCEGVTGCADDETCLCGGCHAIACRAEPTADGCPGECCAREGGCEAPPAACAEASCVEGRTCAWLPRSMGCADREWCDARLGCLSLAGLPDAGGLDAGQDAASTDRADAGSDAAFANDAASPDDAPVPRDAPSLDARSSDAFTVDARLPDAGRDAAVDAAGLCGGTMCGPGRECCAGACVPIGCDDGNECTNDSCGTTGCRHVNRSGACTDDGNPCTTDSCSGGSCTHPNRTGTCDDGDFCTVSDVCTAGVCGGAPRDCDDGNECTTDGCDSARARCVGGFLSGSPCNDGDACTGPDTCLGATCRGAPITCDDGNPCTEDTCDSLTGCMAGTACASFPVGSPAYYGSAICCDPGAVGGSDRYCTDRNYDEANCTACGVECNPGEVCSPGSGPSQPRCRCGSTTGLGQPACRTGAMPSCCSDACVDLATSATNCGVCGRVCSGGTPNCVSGTCRS